MSRFKNYSCLTGENWVVGRYLLPIIQEFAKKQEGVVLDLGCGESPFRHYFSNAKSYQRMDRYPCDASVVQADMMEIPLADRSVDTVLIFQAITDVPYPEKVLKEVRRILQKHGKLIIFESMTYPEHDAPYDYFRLMPEGLRILAADAGLNMIRLDRLGGLFTRFALLWNTFVMGSLKRYKILKPIAVIGIVCGNLINYGLDRLLPHPRLASDYLAVIEMTESVSE